MSWSMPELVENQRVSHEYALTYLIEQYARPLSIATGYIRLDGLHSIGTLLREEPDRSVRLLLGAMPEPGLGEDAPLQEPLQAGRIFDRTLERLRAERDFSAFPPSRRFERLQAVDEFLARESVEVRRYTRRFLHGKSYILSDPEGHNPGAALVTSANLTGAGLNRNLELGLVHYQPGIVHDAIAWFENLWEAAEPFDEQLRDLLFPPLPEFDAETIFLRILLELYGDELEEIEVAPDHRSLTRFQRDGYLRANRIVDQFGGVLYADGVGTGKTMIGVEFIREYSGNRGLHTLVVSPAQLRETTWERALNQANLPGQVVSYQDLAQDEQLAAADATQRRRVLSLHKDTYRLVIVDEAHAFRNADNTWYAALDRLLGGQPKALVLLTATPVNNALWDLYNMIMLFARHESAFSDVPLRIRNLRQFFREAGANDPDLLSAARLFPLLDNIAVRRDRAFIQRYYHGETFSDGTPVRFPQPVLIERRYDLDSVYPGVFADMVRSIEKLTMARYQPHRYLRRGAEEDNREAALAGLLQSALLKRFESSPVAALETVTRMVRAHELILESINSYGAVPSLLTIRDLVASTNEGDVLPETIEDALSDEYAFREIHEFRDSFVDDLKKDRELLTAMQATLTELLDLPDPKLNALAEILRSTPAKKVAVFATFADTVRYVADAIEDDPDRFGGKAVTTVIGNEFGAAERTRELERFCPVSMTEDPSYQPPNGEVDLLLTTDVLSEGQNLQDAQAVISVDMPWNPQRVVQRNGRVIRLKSPHDKVYLHTLLPEQGDLEELLRLEATLRAKIAAANVSVGMESQVLSTVDLESRVYADLKEFTDRLEHGDTTLLEEGEGEGSGSYQGEEFRARLRRAQAEGEVNRLREMPWGVGAAVGRNLPEDVARPAVFFAAKTWSGERKWCLVDAAGQVSREDLEMLRMIDPHGASPAHVPEELDLDSYWAVAAGEICNSHNAELDPALREERLPASLRWARQILVRPEVPADPDLDRVYESLGVGRGPLVQRALAQIRREFNADEITVADAAQRIADVVETYGLRPPTRSEQPGTPIGPNDLGVVCYMVVR